MLSYLRITNLALIEELSMTFESGLNVVTGETGSGKSLVLKAIDFLAGAKATGEIVRAGMDSATIEGIFEFSLGVIGDFGDLIADAGISLEGQSEIIVRREISKTGRSRYFVAGSLVTQGLVRALRPFMVSIQSQGEQHSIGAPESQLEVLDEYSKLADARRQVQMNYREWRESTTAYTKLAGQMKDKTSREDFLRFQLAEIEAVSPLPGEDTQLVTELKAVSNAERIRTLSSEAHRELYEDDGSIVSRLAAIDRNLTELASLDERISPFVEEYRSATNILSDVGEALRDYSGKFEGAEDRIEEIESRLAKLEKLKRRFSTDLAGLERVAREMQQELDASENLELEIERLREVLGEKARLYLSGAGKLSQAREKSLNRFSSVVEDQLRTVALDMCRFEARITPRTPIEPDAKAEDIPSGTGWTASGIDDVEFFFSANPGEPLKPLSSVASGGEISRIFLVLHTLKTDESSAGEDPASVLLDEIDVGIGGKVAEVIGQRLKHLATKRQVFCVTHQPQIAKFADAHFVISKYSDAERTRTTAKRVDSDARITELGRMIGTGDDFDSRRLIDQIFDSNSLPDEKVKRNQPKTRV